MSLCLPQARRGEEEVRTKQPQAASKQRMCKIYTLNQDNANRPIAGRRHKTKAPWAFRLNFEKSKLRAAPTTHGVDGISNFFYLEQRPSQPTPTTLNALESKSNKHHHSHSSCCLLERSTLLPSLRLRSRSSNNRRSSSLLVSSSTLQPKPILILMLSTMDINNVVTCEKTDLRRRLKSVDLAKTKW